MRNHRKYAKRSGRLDMRRIAATYRSAAEAIQSGIYGVMFFRLSTGTVRFKPPTHTHTQAGPWDLIIAHPPCTDLAVSGARWFPEKQKDFRQQKACVFFMQMALADCDRIAVENPIGIMSNVYKKPSQIIHPWMFGEPVSKATCLWLKGLPLLQPSNVVQPEWRTDASGKRYSGAAFYAVDENGKAIAWNDPRTSKARSKTFPGIAKAMAEQWGGIVPPKEET